MKLLLLFPYDYQSQSKPHGPYHSASAQKREYVKKNAIMCFKMRLYIYIYIYIYISTTASLLIKEKKIDIR